jgi:hypothetical protein
MLFIYQFVMFYLLSGAAITLFEIPAFRQSAVGIVLSRPAHGALNDIGLYSIVAHKISIPNH